MNKLIIFGFSLIIANSTKVNPDVISKGINSDLGITIGLNKYQVKENVLNKIRHDGLLMSTGISHEKTTNNTLRKTDLNFIINTLKSRYDPDNASIAINPYFSYRYTRKIKEINHNIPFFLGGIIGSDTHLTYFDNWDESHFYWLTSYFLGIDGVMKYHRRDNSYFHFEMNSPLLAFISRPPERFLNKEINPEFSWIFSKINDNLTLTSINRHIALYINTGYTFQYSNRFKQRIEWRFSYINNHMKKSKNIKILYHTLGITFLF